jgi:hypothetical protein
MPRAIRISRPIPTINRIPPTTAYSSQLRLKFSDSTAWARTKAERGPNTSSTTSGATNPRAM